MKATDPNTGMRGAGTHMVDARWECCIEVNSAQETHDVAARLGEQLQAGDLVVLAGELGAGKTTLTQGLGVGLGVRAGIISPTFVLVRIHPNVPDGQRPGGPPLVHVDAYRLGSAADIDDIDLEDTLDASVTVVEWGRGRVEHLSASRLEIDLHRSVGSGGSAVAGTAGAADAPAVLDFSDGDPDEPRSLVLRGFGPRWPEPPSLPGVRVSSRKGNPTC